MTIKTIVTCTTCDAPISEHPTRHPLRVTINGWPEFEMVEGEFCCWNHAIEWFNMQVKTLGR